MSKYLLERKDIEELNRILGSLEEYIDNVGPRELRGDDFSVKEYRDRFSKALKSHEQKVKV